jgi:phosphatidylserine decarboxylase
MYLPICFRAPLFGLFSAIYGAKIKEATRRYSEYRTFTDFFTRTLKPGLRPIHRETDFYSIASPCDGTVLSSGLINHADSTIRLDEFMIGVIGDDGDQDTASRVDKVKKNHPGVEGLLKSVRERGN